MKVLVIDSHKSSQRTPSENLHWVNANTIAEELGGDLIWSYPTVNDEIKTGYEAIVFVHSSPYSYEDRAWLEQNPDAKLFFVTNEYNLGEPSILWRVAKAGRKYQVIANHPCKASKVVEKYTSAWHEVNLNALCYREFTGTAEKTKSNSTIYYGSFRKGREKYFQKWLTSGKVVVSTHIKNREKFGAIGCNGPFINRLNFGAGDLAQYGYSLYIEDEKTHTYYNHLANRFYEGLSNNVIPVFDESCRGTVQKSGYKSAIFVSGPEDLDGLYPWLTMAKEYGKTDFILPAWREKARQERQATIDAIKTLVLT